MTQPITVPATRSVAVASGSPRSILALAVREARLLCRHPAHLLGLALVACALFAWGGDGQDYRGLYSGLPLLVTMCLGVPVYFAANLRASHNRRSATDDLVAACPMSAPRRTLALCLATAAPFVVAVVLVFCLDFYIASHYVRFEEPGALRLLAGACTVLGAGLLGIMISRWLPWPGAALVVMVGVVALTARLQSYSNQLLGPYTDWALWAPAWFSNSGKAWYGVLPGSPGWHLVYIISLSVMAALGALLVHHEWRRLVLVIGAAVTLVAAVAGVAQWP